MAKVVKRSDDVSGFVVLPRRRVVERTLRWLMRSRRLARDYERLPETDEAPPDACRTEPEHGRTIPRSAPACGYRVAVASAARMASSPAGWPFSSEYGPYGVPHTSVPVACRQL